MTRTRIVRRIAAITTTLLLGCTLFAVPASADVETEMNDVWCRHEVVQDGNHTVLNVRAQPNPNSAIRYQLPLGSVVSARIGSLTNGYLDLNLSLGYSQWGHSAMLRYLGPGDPRCPL